MSDFLVKKKMKMYFTGRGAAGRIPYLTLPYLTLPYLTLPYLSGVVCLRCKRTEHISCPELYKYETEGAVYRFTKGILRLFALSETNWNASV